MSEALLSEADMKVMRKLDELQKRFLSGQLTAQQLNQPLQWLIEDQNLAISSELPFPEPAYWGAVNSYLAGLRQVPWFRPTYPASKEWKVFDKRFEAEFEFSGAQFGTQRREDAELLDWAAKRCGRRVPAEVADRAASEIVLNITHDPNAARDAGQMAVLLVCKDMPLNGVNQERIRRRQHFWGRGWGFAGEVDGIPYLYRRP